MRWLCIVHLETCCQSPLCEVVRVVAQEGIVITQQCVVDGVVGFGKKQVLMLDDYLKNHGENGTSSWKKSKENTVPLFIFYF